MNCIKKCFLILILIVITGCVFYFKKPPYFPSWARFAEFNTPIKVLDTNSSLGRYSDFTKQIELKDLAKIHGHLCDGLVIAYVELKAAFKLLFPNGVVDRTDLRVVTKNGPCWVDATAFLTGARINFGTLSIDSSLVNSIIVQKISTGEAYQVSLKKGVFPNELANLEKEFKTKHKKGQKVSDEEIKKLETMADSLSKKLLTTPPEDLLDIKKLNNYQFKQNIQIGIRTDVINKK